MSDTFATLPLSRAALEQYYISARQAAQFVVQGGHLTRRMGQSREFREFTQYMPGDDVRYIDWRQTMRTTGGHISPMTSDRWLVRRFYAEEHMRLVISIDTLPTMFLPGADSLRQQRQTRHGALRQFWQRRPDAQAINKLQVARWIAEAIGVIALHHGDQITLHTLYGEQAAQGMKGRNDQQMVQQLNYLMQTPPASDASLNTSSLIGLLSSAAVWLIITDLYFDTTQRQALVQRINAAHAARCWVILLELDTWPYERKLIERGAFALQQPGNDKTIEGLVSENDLQVAARRINDERRDFYEQCRGLDYTRWSYPETLLEIAAGGRSDEDNNNAQTLSDFFITHFEQDSTLRRLFTRTNT